MGTRFRRSFKIAPGVRVNLNKKSAERQLRPEGPEAHDQHDRKSHTTVGIPGTACPIRRAPAGSPARSRARSASPQHSGRRPRKIRRWRCCCASSSASSGPIGSMLGKPARASSGWLTAGACGIAGWLIFSPSCSAVSMTPRVVYCGSIPRRPSSKLLTWRRSRTSRSKAPHNRKSPPGISGRVSAFLFGFRVS